MTRVLEGSVRVKGKKARNMKPQSASKGRPARGWGRMRRRLPQEKDVVIDAKTTPVAYERYFNAEDATPAKALQKHIKMSVRNHYPFVPGTQRLSTATGAAKLPGLRAPMFIRCPCFLMVALGQPEADRALKTDAAGCSRPRWWRCALSPTHAMKHQNQRPYAGRSRQQAVKASKMRLFVVDDMSSPQSADNPYRQQQFGKTLQAVRAGAQAAATLLAVLGRNARLGFG